MATVNKLPGVLNFKLVSGDDVSVSCRIGEKQTNPDGTQTFVARDLTGLTFEGYIPGLDHRFRVVSPTPATGDLVMVLDQVVTAQLRGRVPYSVIEIDQAKARKSLLAGHITAKEPGFECCPDEPSVCGEVAEKSCGCRSDCDCDSYSAYHNRQHAHEPSIVKINPAAGVVSIDGRTGAVILGDLVATANTVGTVKPDGSTITVDANGTLTVIGGGGGGGGGYTLPSATTTIKGGVIVGSGLAVAAGGVLSAPVATTTDAGRVKPGTNLGLLADGTLSVTGVPAHTHKISEVNQLQAELDDRPTLTSGKLLPGVLPIATALAAGVVKVDGTSVTVDADGTLHASATGASGGTVTSIALGYTTAAGSVLSVTGTPVTTNGTLTIGFQPQASRKVLAGPTTAGNGMPSFRSLTSDDLTDVTAIGGAVLKATTKTDLQTAIGLSVVGATGSWNDMLDKPTIPTAYVLPVATTATLGGVKPDGTSITIDSSGVLSGASTYTLPVANLTVLGGVMPDGSTVTADATGVLSANLSGYVQKIAGANYVTGNVITGSASNVPLHGLHFSKVGGATTLRSGIGILDSGIVRVGTSYESTTGGVLKSISRLESGVASGIAILTNNYDSTGNQSMSSSISSSATGPTLQLSTPDGTGTLKTSMFQMQSGTSYGLPPISGGTARIQMIADHGSPFTVRLMANSTDAYFGKSTTLNVLYDSNSYLDQGYADSRYEPKQSIADLPFAAALTWDPATTPNFDLTLTGDLVMSLGTGTIPDGTYTGIIRQNAAGNHKLTWPAAIKWPYGIKPAISVAANSVDIVTFVCRKGILNGVLQNSFS